MESHMKSVAQLEAEAKAAAAALAAAKEAERAKTEEQKRIEWKAQQLKEAVARNKALAIHLASVAAELATLGVSATVTLPDDAHLEGYLSALPVMACGVDVCLEQTYSGSRFHKHPDGWKITVGSYGDRKSFPTLKGGGFSYEKIAQEVKARLDVRAAQQKLQGENEAKKAAAGHIVSRLRAEFEGNPFAGRLGAEHYSPGFHGGTTHVAPAGKVYLDLGALSLTEGQARAVLTVLGEVLRKEP